MLVGVVTPEVASGFDVLQDKFVLHVLPEVIVQFVDDIHPLITEVATQVLPFQVVPLVQSAQELEESSKEPLL